MKNNQGFTLIELLVVVAIISLLASITFASLSTARAKGADAAAKEDLTNAMAQAEIYYTSNNNSYYDICTKNGGLLQILQNAAKAENTYYGSSHVGRNNYPKINLNT